MAAASGLRAGDLVRVTKQGDERRGTAGRVCEERTSEDRGPRVTLFLVEFAQARTAERKGGDWYADFQLEFVDETVSGWEMGDVCKGAGKPMTVCELTRSTGLSLAESVALVGARDNVRTDDLVGRATTFFSYSWTGSTLGDVLAALRRALPRLAAGGAAGGGDQQAVWVDMFCASQNLLAGAYRDPAITKESDPAGYAARKEDTDRVFDDAFEPVREVILYASPLCAARETPRAPPLPPALRPRARGQHPGSDSRGARARGAGSASGRRPTTRSSARRASGTGRRRRRRGCGAGRARCHERGATSS